MKIENRQKTLIIITAVAAGLLIGDSLAFEPLIKWWQARSQEITSLRAQVKDGNAEIRREAAIRGHWDEMRTNTLPNDSASAEREIISAFDGWSRDTGVQIAGLHPQWKSDTDDYQTLNCGVEISGTLSTLSQFLYDVEKGPMALKLDSMELSAGDHSGDQMTMTLQISGLARHDPPDHPAMKLKAIHFGAALAFLLAAGGSACAQSHVPSPDDYDRFSKFIAERNIFDPNRYPHRPGYVYHPPHPPTPSVRNPAFSFVGAMAYEKGMFAFFDGNRADYKKALQASEKIANFTVAEISLGGVTLVSADTTNFLPLGFEMRQGNDGVWETNGESTGFSDQSGSSVSSSADSSGGTASPASNPAPASSDANVSDVLKRLMQLRQQENK